MRLVVTRRIHLDEWYADCIPFFRYVLLTSGDIDSAKNEALLKAQESVQAALAGSEDGALMYDHEEGMETRG